jgi:hypothetical protein
MVVYFLGDNNFGNHKSSLPLLVSLSPGPKAKKTHPVTWPSHHCLRPHWDHRGSFRFHRQRRFQQHKCNNSLIWLRRRRKKRKLGLQSHCFDLRLLDLGHVTRPAVEGDEDKGDEENEEENELFCSNLDQMEGKFNC